MSPVTGALEPTAATAAVPSDWGEVADDHDAGCVEELFQNAGRRHGERESQDFRPYAPVQHVYALLVVHHVLPPPAAAGSSFASEGIVVAAPNEGTAMPFCRML